MVIYDITMTVLNFDHLQNTQNHLQKLGAWAEKYYSTGFQSALEEARGYTRV